MIEKYVNNPKEKLWYVCAPPPMVKAMKEILMEMQIPKEKFRIEDWEIAGKHDKE
jgi:ferredoxin-NADP reductase